MRKYAVLVAAVIAGCGNSERPDSEVVIDESALSVYSKSTTPRLISSGVMVAWSE